MLRIYAEMVVMIEEIKPIAEAIKRRDGALASQLRDAAGSVALNCAEGSGSQGGKKIAHYHIALGSMLETVACLDVARAFGYIDGVDPAAADRREKIVRTLRNLVR